MYSLQVATKKELNGLASSVHEIAKKPDEYMQEMMMLANVVDRIEKWINQIAAKTGAKLEYQI